MQCGVICCSSGFADFVRQWPRAQRSLSADLAFCYFFAKKKVMGNLLCSPEIINAVFGLLMALMNTRSCVGFLKSHIIKTWAFVTPKATTTFVKVIACPASADQLRPKGGKTMVACAVAEHSNNLQKEGP